TAAGTGTAGADPASGAGEGSTEVTVEQFFQTDLRVAEVKAAERVPKTDKLLKLILDVGGETRQVVSGIAQRYAPEDLVGRKVVLVANLKPAKIRGEWSQGMILAADGPDGPHVLFVDADVPSGAKVK
ncbi:methionine--tRNA ligase subunit beta, partial [Calditerricola satsumensis]